VVTFPGGRKMYIDIRDIENFIERNKMTYVQIPAPIITSALPSGLTS
jgi:hypothetical protein